MAIDNFGELSVQISKYLHRNDLTAERTDWIDMASSRLGMELRTDANQTTVTISDFVPASPTGFYPLDPLTEEIRAVSWLDNERLINLPILSVDQTQRVDPNGTRPVGYQIINETTLNLFPATGTDLLIRAWVTPVLPAIPSTSTNTVLITYPFLYLYAALMEGHTFTQDWAQRDQVALVYDRELRRANEQALQARAPAGSAMSAARGLTMTSSPARGM